MDKITFKGNRDEWMHLKRCLRVAHPNCRWASSFVGPTSEHLTIYNAAHAAVATVTAEVNGPQSGVCGGCNKGVYFWECDKEESRYWAICDDCAIVTIEHAHFACRTCGFADDVSPPYWH